ncbi:MAG: carbamoyltransferase HypF [Firmicutes bacterium]|nr:carbamoyltransferase HypF [Bacillota bacterium]
MNTLTTETIKLWGIVQGVGFRPFVAKLADQMHMKGSVLNIGGLVEITVTDTSQRIDAFVEALQQEKPKPAEIVHIKRTPRPLTEFTDFQIKGSAEGGDDAAMIPPDMAICPDCLKELYAEDDPRHLHPFISCMLCGPRYTIIDRIPYDRDNTSMIDFPMCGFCQVQYSDLHDRRHHAQTISCHACGPYLKWTGPSDGQPASLRHKSADDQNLLDQAAQILAGGGVIAFKCVGGYNLVADPFNDDAVRKLRQIKGREAKPFAVMFRDLKEVQYYCHVSDVEANLLESSARPILLLEHKLEEPGFAPAATRRFPQTEEGTPDPSYTDLLSSRFIGTFLPSLAAQYLLLDRISPLIFTSANKSDLPMIKDDDEMTAWFNAEPDIDGILYNERRIRVRADDSVCRVIDDQPQMIRRSKGYAPLPLYVDEAPGPRFIFAAGSQLKNSFALTNGSFLYMSQYFGDLDTVENQQIYQENVRRMAQLLRIRPQAVVCDMHPMYESTIFARDFAARHGLPLLQVQHHHAHVASVMAENNLTGKVIGVSFDGTGYGTDGCIWGGEVLLCEGSSCDRFSHLKYVQMIGGDSSMKDARRSALSHMAAAAVSRPDIISYDEQGCRQFSIDLKDILEFGAERMMGCPDARLILRAIDSGVNTILSSSMGRLFDAVCALLDIKDYNDYEGQCACMLEDAAAFARRHPGTDPASDLALAFHERVIDAIVRECRLVREQSGANQVALTGGTFQNRILMEGTLSKLRALGFQPYYNISVSPNDGGIALGQAFIAMHAGR